MEGGVEEQHHPEREKSSDQGAGDAVRGADQSDQEERDGEDAEEELAGLASEEGGDKAEELLGLEPGLPVGLVVQGDGADAMGEELHGGQTLRQGDQSAEDDAARQEDDGAEGDSERNSFQRPMQPESHCHQETGIDQGFRVSGQDFQAKGGDPEEPDSKRGAAPEHQGSQVKNHEPG